MTAHRTIVSLTTTSAREQIAQFTVLSLLQQDPAPDVVRLNISDHPYLYDEGMPEAPRWLATPPFDRVEVHWGPNTGPYRKLLPTIQDADDDDLVVTADDDVIYHPTWLRSLTDAATEHPDHIVCGRAVRVTRNVLGRTKSYHHFPKSGSVVGAVGLIPTGVCGVVYRRRLLDLPFLFSDEAYRLTPTNDDIWFWFASVRRGTPVTVERAAQKAVSKITTPKKLSSLNTRLQTAAQRQAPLAVRGVRHVTRSVAGQFGWPVVANDLAIRRAREFSDATPVVVNTEH